MAMGRQRRAAENPFYRALNELLDENGFDRFAEDLCEEFYAGNVDRPGIPPGELGVGRRGGRDGADDGLGRRGVAGGDAGRSGGAAGGAGRGGGGSGVRQGVPLERDDEGGRGSGVAQLRERARPGSPELEAGEGRSEAGLREPEADSRGARQVVVAVAGREAGADVRAPAGDGRNAACARSRSGGGPKADADSRRRLQSGVADATTLRSRHASEPAGPPRRSASCARLLLGRGCIRCLAPNSQSFCRSQSVLRPRGPFPDPISPHSRCRDPLNARLNLVFLRSAQSLFATDC